MNRTAVGVILLLVLLLGGIGSAAGLARESEAMASRMDAAAQLAMAGDLQKAQALAEEVRHSWENTLPVHAVFADHDPLDIIALGFSRLELYEQAGDRMGCALVCGELAERFRTLGDAHGAQWWNIL